MSNMISAVRKYIFNPKTGQILTRTPASWLGIILFYMCFLSSLAGFWYGLLLLHFRTIPEDIPKYMLNQSLIGVNPGLGVIPRRDPFLDDSTFTSTLIHINRSNHHLWTTQIELFLARYQNQSADTKACNGPGNPRLEKVPCRFDVTSLGPCARHPYGFTNTSTEPCFLLKVNKIINWMPKAFHSISNDMPASVQDLVHANPHRMYIDCTSKVGQFWQYHPPDRSIDLKFYPFRGPKTTFQSPIVAIQLNRSFPRHEAVDIICKLWTQDILHDTKPGHNQGLITFQVLISS